MTCALNEDSNQSVHPHSLIRDFRVHLLNVVFRFIVFLTFATLIFRGTDILKCFRESLGIRDNEIRLYFIFQGRIIGKVDNADVELQGNILVIKSQYKAIRPGAPRPVKREILYSD